MGPGELFARYRTDKVAKQFVDDYVHEIAFHLANLGITFDPSRIVLGAGLMRSRATDLGNALSLVVLCEQILREKEANP